MNWTVLEAKQFFFYLFSAYSGLKSESKFRLKRKVRKTYYKKVMYMESMNGLIWVKNPRALPTDEQLTISMLVYTCVAAVLTPILVGELVDFLVKCISHLGRSSFVCYTYLIRM